MRGTRLGKFLISNLWPGMSAVAADCLDDMPGPTTRLRTEKVQNQLLLFSLSTVTGAAIQGLTMS